MTILAKFRHFGNKNSNGQLAHYRRQNFDPTLANFYAIGQMYIIVNNQILKEKSSHLVTLARTNNLNCYWLIFSEICNWRPPNTSSRHPRPDRARVQRLEDGPSQRGHRAGGQRGQAGWGVRHHRAGPRYPRRDSYWGQAAGIFLKKWTNPGLFFVCFQSFQTNNTIFTTNQCEKCPSIIRPRDSNPQPFNMSCHI